MLWPRFRKAPARPTGGGLLRRRQSPARRADLAYINLGLTETRRCDSTKSRLRTIFLPSGGAFSEKRQVAKFDLIEKSFLTVILCYRIDAFVPSLRWRKLALAGS